MDEYLIMNMEQGTWNMGHGRLILIPTLLGDSPVESVLPANMKGQLSRIRHYVVEDLRTARRFLKKVDRNIDIDSLDFQVLNEHTQPEEIPPFLEPAFKGSDIGLMSEAGSPCVADPGSLLVSFAHEKKIRVVPMAGPSSITLALMASGFNGQNFAFHGYLPVEPKQRNAALKRLEQEAWHDDQTQVFIETPYRNMKLFEAILNTCRPETRLCIAANLTTPNEMIRSLSLAAWKKNPPAIHKQPAVFLLYRY